MNEIVLAKAQSLIIGIIDGLPDNVLPDELKQRDKREPGRERKMMYENKLARAVYRRFRTQREKLKYTLELWYPQRAKADPPIEDIFTDEKSEAEILKILLLAYGHGIQLFEDGILIGLDYTLFNKEAATWAKKHSTRLFKLLDDVSRETVRSAVSAFIETPGMNVGDVMGILTNQPGSVFDSKRALRTAVTEITDAYAQAELDAGLQLKKQFSDVRVIKTWFTNNDSLVCPICGPLNGVSVEVGHPFIGGDGGEYEGPPSHPNCILPGNEVLPIGKISAAAKSFYEGGCVEISLASGRKLTVTENHPILTSRGWIPAYLIDERIDSIFTGNINGIAPIVNPNNQQSPAMIEDIFTTLKESIFCSTISVPASTEDFNGDGRNIHGDVNIISANRFLGNDFNMLTDKKLSNIKLDRDSFGFSHLPSLGLLDLHEAGNLYSESRSVGGFDLMRPLDSRHSAPLDFFGFGLSARNDISFNEPLSESPAVNTYLARQFIFRFASDITVEKVVKIRNFYFSGHVYDLQCDDYGLYITNGIITHNCRCWISTRTDILGEKELQNEIPALVTEIGSREQINKLREEWIGSLSEEEQISIRRWGESGRHIRNIQSGDISNMSEAEITRANKLNELFTSAIDKGVEFNGIVYRGLTDVPINDIDEWIKNGNIILKNDQSASKLYNVSKTFSVTGVKNSNAVEFIIDQKHGIDLFEQTAVTQGGSLIPEAEVVIRKNAKYKIVDYDYKLKDGRSIIEKALDYFSGTEYSWPDNLPEGWHPSDDFSGRYVLTLKEVAD